MLLPQVLAQFPQTIAIMQESRTMLLTMHSTMSGTLGNMGNNRVMRPPWEVRSTPPKTTILFTCRQKF